MTDNRRQALIAAYMHRGLRRYPQQNGECASCGAKLIGGQSSRRYCNQKCRHAAYYAKIQATTGRACAQCGHALPDGTKSTYCNKQCYDASRVGTLRQKSCAECGKSFETRIKGQRHCSYECSTATAIAQSQARLLALPQTSRCHCDTPILDKTLDLGATCSKCGSPAREDLGGPDDLERVRYRAQLNRLRKSMEAAA